MRCKYTKKIANELFKCYLYLDIDLYFHHNYGQSYIIFHKSFIKSKSLFLYITNQLITEVII